MWTVCSLCVHWDIKATKNLTGNCMYAPLSSICGAILFVFFLLKLRKMVWCQTSWWACQLPHTYTELCDWEILIWLPKHSIWNLQSSAVVYYLILNKEFLFGRKTLQQFWKEPKTFLQRSLFQQFNSLPSSSDKPLFGQFYRMCFSCFIVVPALDSSICVMNSHFSEAVFK